ncbi:histidine phosphatase family protein [Lysinibacter cavernae]|uniref:Broad specificity phosphatase PhoE n=1 Tax=Lysinibacter cavernae TaxID=1640652 RepID=A0A7X5R1X0_9MICO|nr:broad specificity phosphatase PhoE [Lysinibacter cavernae]
MPEKQLHLVRHGEVHNPDGVLYGRIPGFHLSELGEQMAVAAADDLATRGRNITTLLASPLQRAQESAAPISKALNLPIITEHRVIEPTNSFEGLPNHGKEAAFRKPRYWHRFWNPFRPSWGEPYRSVAGRMRAAMDDAWENSEGDIVVVSHQSPIWMAHLDIAGKRLFHDPRTRRCDLSSITSFEKQSGTWVEVGYANPAAPLLKNAIDIGAV